MPKVNTPRGCIHVHKGNIRYRKVQEGLYMVERAKWVEYMDKPVGWKYIGDVSQEGSFWEFKAKGDVLWRGEFETRAMSADHLMSWVRPMAAWLA